jgi:hypothetical protein
MALLPSKDGLLATPPRYLQVLVGVAIGLCGLGLLALATVAVYRVVRGFQSVDQLLAVSLTTLVAVGSIFAVWACRLISGRGRKIDGGLLSPLGLIIAGILSLLAGGVMVYSRPLAFLEAVGMGLSGLACLGLALRRLRRRPRFGD